MRLHVDSEQIVSDREKRSLLRTANNMLTRSGPITVNYPKVFLAPQVNCCSTIIRRKHKLDSLKHMHAPGINNVIVHFEFSL